MNKRYLLTALMGIFITPFLASQQIRITIPRFSELTPVQRLNREGVEAVIKHKYEKAEGLFFKAYLYDPADPFTLNNLGYVSELQGQVDRAADYYKLAMEQGCEAVIDQSSDKALKGRPMMDALGSIKNMPMRINRINVYAIQLLSQNRGFEAETLLKQTLPLDPNNPFTLNNLAVAEESTGNLEDALKYYDAAAATRSAQVVVVSLKRASRGKPVSEIAAASAAKLRAKMATMSINQIRAHMYAVRGVAALNKNDWAMARKNFEDAYAADPDSAFALNNIGYVSEHDGELETAISYYARARKAVDSGEAIGMASQSGVRGQHLADVALESRRSVNQKLQAQGVAPPESDEPIELLRRDGTSEPSAKSVDQPTEITVPAEPPTR